MEDSKLYRVDRKIIKRQNINYDNIIGFGARTMVNNLRIQVFNEISDDIHLGFVARGSLNEFKQNKIRKEYLEYEYKGLLLHHQGYIITINRVVNSQK